MRGRRKKLPRPLPSPRNQRCLPVAGSLGVGPAGAGAAGVARPWRRARWCGQRQHLKGGRMRDRARSALSVQDSRREAQRQLQCVQGPYISSPQQAAVPYVQSAAFPRALLQISTEGYLESDQLLLVSYLRSAVRRRFATRAGAFVAPRERLSGYFKSGGFWRRFVPTVLKIYTFITKPCNPGMFLSMPSRGLDSSTCGDPRARRSDCLHWGAREPTACACGS